MWVGMYTSKLLHFGATTTQRVEGSHASIKHVLEGKMNLQEVMDRIDPMFLRKRQMESLKLKTDEVSFDALLTSDDRDRLALLMGKITSFALQKIKEASANIRTGINISSDSYSSSARRHTTQCGRKADMTEGYLSPKVTTVETPKCDNVQAESRQLLHDLDGKIASANRQQALTLLTKLRDLSNSAYEPIDSLGMPFIESRWSSIFDQANATCCRESIARVQEVKEEEENRSCFPKLQSMKSDSDYTVILRLVQQAKLKLENSIKETIADDIPSYTPPERTVKIFSPRYDGNCGFRALAEEVYGFEEEWKRVKDDLLNLYLQGQGYYQKFYSCDDTQRMEILKNRDEFCAPRYWFSYPNCCQLAADRYERAVCFYSIEGQCLFLPTYGACPRLQTPIGLWLHLGHIRLLTLELMDVSWPTLNPSHSYACSKLQFYDWSSSYPGCKQ